MKKYLIFSRIVRKNLEVLVSTSCQAVNHVMKNIFVAEAVEQ